MKNNKKRKDFWEWVAENKFKSVVVALLIPYLVNLGLLLGNYTRLLAKVG
jgi:hypothetical protein